MPNITGATVLAAVLFGRVRSTPRPLRQPDLALTLSLTEPAVQITVKSGGGECPVDVDKSSVELQTVRQLSKDKRHRQSQACNEQRPPKRPRNKVEVHIQKHLHELPYR